MGVVKSDGDTDNGAEELADQHSQCTVDKNWAAAEFLNSVERDRSGANID